MVGHLDLSEQKRQIVAELMVIFAGSERGVVQALDLGTLCAILMAEERREEMLAWCEKKLRVRLMLN